MDFTQCTRKRKDGTEFCGSHNKNLPNGKIGDDGSCFNKTKGKRGRKRKNPTINVDDNDIVGIKKYINGELYKTIHISYKTGDDKYVMEGISATILYQYNIKDCYEKKDEIAKEILSVFDKVKPIDGGKVKHQQDKSGKSTLSNILFHFESGDLIMVSCYDWSKKMNYIDHLRISFRTKNFKNFINYKAYK